MKKSAEKLATVPIEHLRRGHCQPRRIFDEDALNELASSIRSIGIIQPPVVREVPGSSGHYEIISGERRWRAAGIAGLREITCLVVSGLPEKKALVTALTENLQREGLSPLEEAEGYKRMCDEHSMTHEAVAEAIGVSRVHVTNMLRLLNLAPLVRRYLDEGKLQTGHAKVLAGLTESQQIRIAMKAARRGLSVRAVEQMAAALKRPSEVMAAASRQNGDADLKAIEQELSDRFGTTVRIHWGAQKKIEINLSSLEQAEGVLAKLRAGSSSGFDDDGEGFTV